MFSLIPGQPINDGFATTHMQPGFREMSDNVSAWKSASLYIGDLSPTANEQDLLQIFSAYGPLISVKVCRNWDSGEPLGYGFLNFENELHAEQALAAYNFKPVCGKPCRLMWSTKRSASCLKEEHAANVFVKGLAKSVDNKMLYDTFSRCGTVLSSRVARNKKGSSLGYGYVSFTSFSSSEQAIRDLNGKALHGQIISVEPFVDKEFRDEKPWSNIHISGIPLNWGKASLVQRFQIYGEIRSAVIMTNDFGVSKGFGFVDFVEHDSAVQAVEDNRKIRFGSVYSANQEEKQPYSSALADPLFELPLEVTPALKKTEKIVGRVPRARQSIENMQSMRSSMYSQRSRQSDPFSSPLFDDEPIDTLNLELLGARKLIRTPFSSSTASTFFDPQINPIQPTYNNEFDDITADLELLKLSQSPPGF